MTTLEEVVGHMDQSSLIMKEKMEEYIDRFIAMYLEKFSLIVDISVRDFIGHSFKFLNRLNSILIKSSTQDVQISEIVQEIEKSVNSYSKDSNFPLRLARYVARFEFNQDDWQKLTESINSSNDIEVIRLTILNYLSAMVSSGTFKVNDYNLPNIMHMFMFDGTSRDAKAKLILCLYELIFGASSALTEEY